MNIILSRQKTQVLTCGKNGILETDIYPDR